MACQLLDIVSQAPIIMHYMAQTSFLSSFSFFPYKAISQYILWSTKGGKKSLQTHDIFFFHVGNHSGSSVDSLTIEYTVHGLRINFELMERLPGCLLAVLPSFRNTIIPLLGRLKLISCLTPRNGNKMRAFSKLGNTASKQPGSPSPTANGQFRKVRPKGFTLCSLMKKSLKCWLGNCKSLKLSLPYSWPWWTILNMNAAP